MYPPPPFIRGDEVEQTFVWSLAVAWYCYYEIVHDLSRSFSLSFSVLACFWLIMSLVPNLLIYQSIISVYMDLIQTAHLPSPSSLPVFLFVAIIHEPLIYRFEI